jgi:ribosomal-protein-alanine N-acetyltransferase
VPLFRREVENITIIPMVEEDLESVLDIERVSFAAPWCRDHFIAELESSYSFPMVATDFEGNVCGYICPMLVIDEGHILNVAVHPIFRGKGIGRILVRKVIDECRERGAEYISLEVRTSNSIAISLYRHIGFVITGRRRKYYENGEDAFIMEYIFSNKEGDDDAI